MAAKGMADTSSFSVKERLVTSVLVHERRQTMVDIQNDFVVRFGKQHCQVQHYWCKL